MSIVKKNHRIFFSNRSILYGMFNILQTSGLIIFCFMTILFFIALIRKRNDIADIGWGIGFLLVAISNQTLFSVGTIRSFLIPALVILWGLRLAIHIYERNKGKSEDFRYKKWREDWGKYFLIRSYLQVFLLQGFFMFLISLPVMIGISSSSPDSIILISLGLLVWLTGFLFESVGDYQLTAFIKDPTSSGKIMTRGLWKYTRHPNYFGEVLGWWGIFILALPSTLWWLALLGPLTISFLILKVSGIPMLEKRYEGNQDFEEYKKRTSAFFPLPPKP